MKICRNIDLVQIKVTSNVEQDNSYGLTYYFPKNVSWAKEVVEKIVVAAPYERTVVGPLRHSYQYLSSPIDGSYIYGQARLKQSVEQPVVGDEVQQGIYFDFYKSDGSVLAKDLSILSLLSTNNNVFELNSMLDLEQSCIHVPGKLARDGSIWLYVFYGGHDDANFQYPTENITVQVPLLPNQKLTFSDIINNYVHIQPNKIKGVYVWENYTQLGGTPILAPGSPSAIALTLRDFNGSYIINNVMDVIVGLNRQDEYPELGMRERDHIYFDHDIDFDNSFIQNLYLSLGTTATIIFEY